MKKKLEHAIDNFNDYVNFYKNNLTQWKKDIDPVYVHHCSLIFEKAWKLDPFFVEYNIDYGRTTTKNTLRNIEEKYAKCAENYEKIVKDFKLLKEKIEKNSHEFYGVIHKIFSNEKPVFITFTKLSDNTSIYMYAQDINETEIGHFRAYGVLSNIKEATYFDFDAKLWAITLMSDNEFNKKYLPERLSNCGITNEMELSKYCAKLNEYYNQIKNV